MTGCREDCTVNCGRCKGRPLSDLHRRIRRALAWGRDAHGGIPFDQKPAWQAGYAEARRRVLMELGTGLASVPSPVESMGEQLSWGGIAAMEARLNGGSAPIPTEATGSNAEQRTGHPMTDLLLDAGLVTPTYNANCAVCGGAPESTLHLGLPTTKGHRYEPASSADAKPSVDAVEGHGVHEHVYRCQDCGLVESDVLSDERLAANAPSEQSS